MSKAEKNQVCFKETTSRANITESYTEPRRLGPVLQMICAHLQIQLLHSTFKPLLKHKHICRLCDASLYRPCSGSLPSIISFNNYIGHGSNTTVKFADDTVMLGVISNNNEAAYMEEVKNLAS